MAIQDFATHKYQVLPPRPTGGFKVGTIMLAKHVLSGSDLGVDSRWVINNIDKNGIVTFTPISSRHVDSTRSRPLTGFVPYAAQGLHTTKSYFITLPQHTDANL